jgi:hypothetical protein
MIEIRMSEGNDVEIITSDLLQLLFESYLQVNFRRVVVFGFLAMAEVEQYAATTGQDYLGRVTVANRAKDHFMGVCHDRPFKGTVEDKKMRLQF